MDIEKAYAWMILVVFLIAMLLVGSIVFGEEKPKPPETTKHICKQYLILEVVVADAVEGQIVCPKDTPNCPKGTFDQLKTGSMSLVELLNTGKAYIRYQSGNVECVEAK